MNSFKFLVLGALLTTSGCASLTNTEKTLAVMAGAAVLGGVVGAATAPESDNPAAHALLWGGVAASLAGAGSLIVNNNDKEVSEKSRQILALQKELSSLNGDDANFTSNEVSTTLEKSLPDEYKKLVEPGKWRIYKMNQWVSEGENTLVHKDKMIRVVPPQLRVKTSQND